MFRLPFGGAVNSEKTHKKMGGYHIWLFEFSYIRWEARKKKKKLLLAYFHSLNKWQ